MTKSYGKRLTTMVGGGTMNAQILRKLCKCNTFNNEVARISQCVKWNVEQITEGGLENVHVHILIPKLHNINFSVGKKMSTKMPGSRNRLDVTDEYKFPEGN